MLDKTDDIAVSAESWLAQFEAALSDGDDAALKSLFLVESYWRDVLALSWNLQTLNGTDAILRELPALARRTTPKDFAIDPDRAVPRRVTRAGRAYSQRAPRYCGRHGCRASDRRTAADPERRQRDSGRYHPRYDNPAACAGPFACTADA